MKEMKKDHKTKMEKKMPMKEMVKKKMTGTSEGEKMFMDACKKSGMG